jgi:hypothetical protein
MSNQITGRAYITIKGARLRSKEGATLKFGGVEREDVLGDAGVLGYAEKVIAPEVECTLAHNAAFSLKSFMDITDESLHFETDTGKIYSMTNAWCKGALELTKGEVKLRFGAISCEEN